MRSCYMRDGATCNYAHIFLTGWLYLNMTQYACSSWYYGLKEGIELVFERVKIN